MLSSYWKGLALNKSKNNLESMLFDYKEVVRLDSLNSIFNLILLRYILSFQKSKMLTLNILL